MCGCTALQNIGGIPNADLRAGRNAEAAFAFDTGPGNMLIDDALSARPAVRWIMADGVLAAAEPCR